jgi:hypothetical protein
MSQAEMVFANGSVNNIFANAPMRAQYTCAGGGGTEVYRTLFSYFGFRFSQLSGFPGTPDEGSLVAHFVHSALPAVGEFQSSSAHLNAVQHATRYAFGSNLMDVPTDCPQRERRGWLGDAQITVEAVLHNFDGALFYRKWLRDFVDAQALSNETMGGGGALPDCVPYYDHGHVEADPGWGIAAWNVASLYASYFDDGDFEEEYYPSLRAYIEHWVALASSHGGSLPFAYYGKYANRPAANPTTHPPLTPLTPPDVLGNLTLPSPPQGTGCSTGPGRGTSVPSTTLSSSTSQRSTARPSGPGGSATRLTLRATAAWPPRRARSTDSCTSTRARAASRTAATRASSSR